MINDSTELVHRIKLNEIKCDLQTAKTDFINITYQLHFFLSVGPLGFKKKIRTVDLTFINTPSSPVIVDRKLSKRYRSLVLTSQSEEMDYVMMLPYSKVNPEVDAVTL